MIEIEHEFDAPDSEIIEYHVGKNEVPIPVYCANKQPFDTKKALANTIQCPVRYLSKAPPNVVTENFCFVVDGDNVSFDAICTDSTTWWKDTGTATRYYYTESLKTFYQVTMLMSKGQLKTAYKTRANGQGMEQVPLQKVFRVSRYFSYWKSCFNFHRIISLVSPVIHEGEEEYGFKKRIFIQYIWRTQNQAEKERVAIEYTSANISAAERKRLSFAQAHKNSVDVLPTVPSFMGKAPGDTNLENQ